MLPRDAIEDHSDALADRAGDDRPRAPEDQQRHDRDPLDVLLATAGELRFGELFEQHVCLAIKHAVALLDDRVADRLREVALAIPGGPRKSASSCCATKRPVASSKTSLRSIFLLKSKASSVRPVTAKPYDGRPGDQRQQVATWAASKPIKTQVSCHSRSASFRAHELSA